MTKQNKLKSSFLDKLRSPERFKRLKDGWIKDSLLGLDWGPSSTTVINQKDAIEYCEKLNGRLPEEYELATLIDRSKYSPALVSPEIFSDTKTDAWYWTITPYAWNLDYAWIVNFYSGYVNGTHKDYNNYARPVRDS